jgi:23S rRNA-/tRNA-specific pseudouridylate synthase
LSERSKQSQSQRPELQIIFEDHDFAFLSKPSNCPVKGLSQKDRQENPDAYNFHERVAEYFREKYRYSPRLRVNIDKALTFPSIFLIGVSISGIMSRFIFLPVVHSRDFHHGLRTVQATSGIVVYAKHQDADRYIEELLAKSEKNLLKVYLAVVAGTPETETGVIRGGIMKHPKKPR